MSKKCTRLPAAACADLLPQVRGVGMLKSLKERDVLYIDSGAPPHMCLNRYLWTARSYIFQAPEIPTPVSEWSSSCCSSLEKCRTSHAKPEALSPNNPRPDRRCIPCIRLFPGTPRRGFRRGGRGPPAEGAFWVGSRPLVSLLWCYIVTRCTECGK